MTRKQKAELIARNLKEIYPEPCVPLRYSDPYTLLIAVLLSAQCTDKRVNTVTPQLFELADTPQKMAVQAPSVVQAIIRPCGLSERKAAAIVQLSRDLVANHGGRVPSTFDELERLPGVGHKTASVVMVQGFGYPAFPVDTHIYRLARKWGLSESVGVTGVERDLKAVFPKSEWGKLHLRMIHYGRDYCPARGCRESCSICRLLGVS